MRKKGQKKTVHLDQWIEIEQTDGGCVVTRYPPNDELEELRQKMDPPAELIYRRMFFVTAVPPEYMQLVWSGESEPTGGLYLQRILPAEWLSIVEAERNSGSDAMVLSGSPQPRPEEFGPCPCPECKKEREQGLKSRYEVRQGEESRG
jgi:hypothetical protein